MLHAFIVNPVAGKKDAGKTLIPHILEVCRKHNIGYAVEITRSSGHATALAEEFAKSGKPVRLYAVGGDGTLNEVVQGAYPFENAAVTSIPVGSGNDFVRNFASPEAFLDVEALLFGPVVRCDLAQTEKGIALAITSAGIDAEIAYKMPKYRRIPFLGGSMAYTIAILDRLLKPIGSALQITIDGVEHSGQYSICAVCNGQTYGGGFLAAPMAKLDDGLLDVILVKKISRLKVAQVIGAYKRGNHWKNEQIAPSFRKIMEHYHAGEVRITPKNVTSLVLNIDGECGPAEQLYAKILPDALRFVLPVSMAGKTLPTLSVPISAISRE